MTGFQYILAIASSIIIILVGWNEEMGSPLVPIVLCLLFLSFLAALFWLHLYPLLPQP